MSYNLISYQRCTMSYEPSAPVFSQTKTSLNTFHHEGHEEHEGFETASNKVTSTEQYRSKLIEKYQHRQH